MAGTIIADDIQHSTAGSVGTEYVVDAGNKGYCRSQGTGTPSIGISMNTSSITDNGTGDTTFTYSNSFSQNACCPANSETGAFAAASPQVLVNATGSVRLKTHNTSGAASDDVGKHVCYQGNLA